MILYTVFPGYQLTQVGHIARALLSVHALRMAYRNRHALRMAYRNRHALRMAYRKPCVAPYPIS